MMTLKTYIAMILAASMFAGVHADAIADAAKKFTCGLTTPDTCSDPDLRGDALKFSVDCHMNYAALSDGRNTYEMSWARTISGCTAWNRNTWPVGCEKSDCAMFKKQLEAGWEATAAPIAAPSPPIAAPGRDNTCSSAGNGVCDEGANGGGGTCDEGTDCVDCGNCLDCPAKTSWNPHRRQCEGVSATSTPGLCGLDFREYMGSLITFSQCATLCREEPDCQTFSYGDAGCRISKCYTQEDKDYIYKQGWMGKGTIPACATDKQCLSETHSHFSSHRMYTLTATKPFLDQATVAKIMKTAAGALMLKAGDDSADDESESDSDGTDDTQDGDGIDDTTLALLIVIVVLVAFSSGLSFLVYQQASALTLAANNPAPTETYRRDTTMSTDSTMSFGGTAVGGGDGGDSRKPSVSII